MQERHERPNTHSSSQFIIACFEVFVWLTPELWWYGQVVSHNAVGNAFRVMQLLFHKIWNVPAEHAAVIAAAPVCHMG